MERWVVGGCVGGRRARAVPPPAVTRLPDVSPPPCPVCRAVPSVLRYIAPCCVLCRKQSLRYGTRILTETVDRVELGQGPPFTLWTNARTVRGWVGGGRGGDAHACLPCMGPWGWGKGRGVQGWGKCVGGCKHPAWGC